MWFKGQEHRIATPSGIPANEAVEVTCHEHYRLSEMGSDEPVCQPRGQWEIGKTCEPIYCPAYGAVRFGQVSTQDYVRAGTRVRITCHEWYEPAGPEHGATADPMCLDTGEFEQGITCVPRPCPKQGGDCEQAQTIAQVPHVSQVAERDWEAELQRPETHDYAPNVFDHEPRPYSLDTYSASEPFRRDHNSGYRPYSRKHWLRTRASYAATRRPIGGMLPPAAIDGEEGYDAEADRDPGFYAGGQGAHP